jgi:Family of unknown function (DUF5681)
MSDTTGNALALPTETTMPETTLLETTLPATNAERTLDGRFAPGSHANPFGRPRGSRNRPRTAMETLLSSEAEAISGKLVALALSGDSTALRLCTERLMPRLKSRPMQLELPPLNTPTDVANALTMVLEAAACGEIDTDQARTLAAVLDARRKSFETIELEERLTLIEKKVSRDRRAL